MARRIFITGGTGYMGCTVIPQLVERCHDVRALVRKGSEGKLPSVAGHVTGDPLRMDSYTDKVRPADTFLHLIGVPHPSPTKAKQFLEIDFVSVEVAVRAASQAGVQHFVYLSVAHPAPMMKSYIAVRSECEEMIRAANFPSATFLRPWYVLGPGHVWPYALLPFYWVFERLPGTKESAQRLGLVNLTQMVNTLLWAVDNPASGVQILDVPKIREIGEKVAEPSTTT
jgi:uncharacterized protein YbjT (DUF2867 family)